jgi:hypothetical protein
MAAKARLVLQRLLVQAAELSPQVLGLIGRKSSSLLRGCRGGYLPPGATGGVFH